MPSIPTAGGVDGPQYADYYDTTDTNQIAAASANVRYLMGLLKNNDALFISDIAGKVTIYEAQSDAPVLMPLIQLRKTPELEKSVSEKEVRARLKEFIASLPPGLRREVQANMKLPFSRQDPKLTAFTGMLRDMAELSLWASNFNEDPLNVNSVGGPTAAALLSAAGNIQNGVDVIDHLSNNLRAEHKRMPDIDPDRVVVGEYLKLLAEVISGAKQFLQAMEAADAEVDKMYSVSQRESAAEKLEKTLRAYHKAAKAAAKQKKIALIMKIVTVIVAAIALIATVLTGGAGAILLALAFTALTMADQFGGGFMTEGIQSLMQALPAKPPGLREAIMVAMIIVIVIIAKQAGTVGPTLMEQAGTEVAKAAAKQAVARVVAMQIGMTLVATSEVVTTIARSIAKLLPISKEDQEIVAMVLQMIIMILAMMYGAKGMGPLPITRLGIAMETMGDLAGAGAKAYSAYTHIQIAMLLREKSRIEAALTEIDTALEIMGMTRKQIEAARKEFNELIQLLSDLFTRIIQQGMQVTAGLAQAG